MGTVALKLISIVTALAIVVSCGMQPNTDLTSVDPGFTPIKDYDSNPFTNQTETETVTAVFLAGVMSVIVLGTGTAFVKLLQNISGVKSGTKSSGQLVTIMGHPEVAGKTLKIQYKIPKFRREETTKLYTENMNRLIELRVTNNNFGDRLLQIVNPSRGPQRLADRLGELNMNQEQLQTLVKITEAAPTEFRLETLEVLIDVKNAIKSKSFKDQDATELFRRLTGLNVVTNQSNPLYRRISQLNPAEQQAEVEKILRTGSPKEGFLAILSKMQPRRRQLLNLRPSNDEEATLAKTIDWLLN